MPHGITVDQVELALLAARNQKMRNAGRLVGKKHNPARSQVRIRAFQGTLVQGREPVTQGEPGCTRQLQNTVTQIGVRRDVRVVVEGSVSGA